jgi:hypothetical protein
MAAGLPVVASDWDGYRELVEHGTTGFLAPVYWPTFGREFEILGLSASVGFECRSALLASATAVDCAAMMNACRLLSDRPDLRRAFGDAGRQRAWRTFDYRVVVRQWESTMDELVETARRLASAEAAPVRHDPLAYRAQWVFQHYPTRTLDDADVVKLTEFGRRWLAGDVEIDVVKPIAAPFFELALEPGARAVHGAGGAMTVGELIVHLRKEHETDLMARAVVARLQKYGLLAVEGGPHVDQWLRTRTASAIDVGSEIVNAETL